MNNEGDFLYVFGWFEFLNSTPGNKFYFLKCTPGTFGWTWTWNLALNAPKIKDLVEMCHKLQTGLFGLPTQPFSTLLRGLRDY